MFVLAHSSVRAAYQKFIGTSFPRRLVYNGRSDASVRDLHTIDYHLALLNSCGIETTKGARPPSPTLKPPSPAYRLPGKFQGCPFVLIHPGTARPEKLWSMDGWCEVIDHLHDQGHAIVVTGGSDVLG